MWPLCDRFQHAPVPLQTRHSSGLRGTSPSERVAGVARPDACCQTVRTRSRRSQRASLLVLRPHDGLNLARTRAYKASHPACAGHRVSASTGACQADATNQTSCTPGTVARPPGDVRRAGVIRGDTASRMRDAPWSLYIWPQQRLRRRRLQQRTSACRRPVAPHSAAAPGAACIATRVRAHTPARACGQEAPAGPAPPTASRSAGAAPGVLLHAEHRHRRVTREGCSR